MSTTHADAAVTALQGACSDAYRATYIAGTHFASARTALMEATDVVVAMQAMIDLVVAAESLHDAADQAVKSLRAVLAEQMSETGCTQVQGTHHAASLARKPQFLAIENEELIPRQFWVQPPEQLDRQRLKDALKVGIEVSGVSLATPNEPVLRVTARKETTTP